MELCFPQIWRSLVNAFWGLEFAHPPPALEKIAKPSITQPGIVRFVCSNFAQTLVTWHLVLQVFKVNGSKVKVTALNDVVLAEKIVAFHERIGWRSLNFVNYSKAWRNAWHMFKVIILNIQIAITSGVRLLGGPPRVTLTLVTPLAITPPRVVRTNLVQSFITSQAIDSKCSRSGVKVTACINSKNAIRQQEIG